MTVERSLTPEERQEALAQARGVLARLWGRKLEMLSAAGAGLCDDCKREADVRLRYAGKLALCRDCASSRRRVRDAIGNPQRVADLEKVA